MPTTKAVDHVYVYAAVEGTPTTLPSDGMPNGGAPSAIAIADHISLIVSPVPSALYNASLIEAKLADLDWVAAAGAAHHAVVEALAASGQVLVPFRLLTIFTSEEKAVAAIRGKLPAITRAFERVRGHEEWVLRVGKPDPSRIERTREATPAASGTDFLSRKAAARRDELERAERVKADAAASYDALQQLADAATLKTVDPAGSLLLDAAFLVTPTAVDAMKDTLTRAAARLLSDGCPVSLTGPWPPYSFASLESDSDG